MNGHVHPSQVLRTCDPRSWPLSSLLTTTTVLYTRPRTYWSCKGIYSPTKQCVRGPFASESREHLLEDPHPGMSEVTSRCGVHPGCRSKREKSHSTAAATASTRCCSGKTGGAQQSGSSCAAPQPRPPSPPPRRTGAQSRGTGAVPRRGPWRGQTARAGGAGSRRPQSRGTRLGRGRPPLPRGGSAVSHNGPSTVFRLNAYREGVRAGETYSTANNVPRY